MLIPTSMEMVNPSKRPVPGPEGYFYRPSPVDPNVTDRFLKTTSTEVEDMKMAAPEARNLGPGYSDLAQETFKLLRSGQTEHVQQEAKSDSDYKNLESMRSKALQQRAEFQ